MSSCITIWEREHAYKFTRWCDPPGGKHRQLARQVGALRVFLSISHSFPDGYSCLADSALHGDLVWESRVHVHGLRLRHDLALSQRTRRSPRCTSTVEGPETPSPPCLPAQEEARTAPPPPLCLITTGNSCEAEGGPCAGSTMCRNRGHDGSTPHDDGRGRVSRALPHRC